jgi:hypothetical protein
MVVFKATIRIKLRFIEFINRVLEFSLVKVFSEGLKKYN